MDINYKTVEELRFLTFPGTFNTESFFSLQDERYNNYAERIDNNKISLNDILIIREIFLKCGYNFKDDTKFENLLIDLFEAKNKGSLTKKMPDFDIEKYDKVLAKCQIDEIPQESKPLLYFEKDGTKYVGFQKYIKAALVLKERIKAFKEENKKGYESLNRENIKEAIERAIDDIKENKPCPEQKVAIATSLINKAFSVITGGPGTGKTTVVFTLINAFVKLNEVKTDDIVLLAPTGRASARIKDQVKAQAIDCKDFDFAGIKNKTIHSYLGKISLDEKNKKEEKLVIVDESSMVDIYLMAALFNSLDPNKTSLILVGDYNQLPSVDAGCVMADLSDYNKVNDTVLDIIKELLPENIFDNDQDNGEKPQKPCEFISRLNWNHRANSKDLNDAFKAIENNRDLFEKIINLRESDDFIKKGAYYIDFKDNTNDKIGFISKFLKKAYFDKDSGLQDKSYFEYVKDVKINDKNPLKEDDEVKKKIDTILSHLNKYKILTPLHKGLFGCDSINRRFINEYKKEIKYKAGEIFPGMGIMITKNNYRDNINNGDVGVVLEGSSGILYGVFKVKDEYKAFPLTSLDNYDYAFAMTVHKSQGSEYEHVLIPIPEYDENNDILNKQLLYTAVTRAKESFILQGSKENIINMCQKTVKRENAIDLFN